MMFLLVFFFFFYVLGKAGGMNKDANKSTSVNMRSEGQ